MYYAIIFEDVNNKDNSKSTWEDWHLIPSSRPVIAQPTPVYKYVDIPGRSVALDITKYLTGKVTYSDRKGSLEFLALNNRGNVENYGQNMARKYQFGGWYTYEGFAKDAAEVYYTKWISRRDDIAKFLDGRKFKVYLEDDSDHYYRGRVFFKDWKSDSPFSKVTIEYQLEPFRYKKDSETEDGL